MLKSFSALCLSLLLVSLPSYADKIPALKSKNTLTDAINWHSSGKRDLKQILNKTDKKQYVLIHVKTSSKGDIWIENCTSHGLTTIAYPGQSVICQINPNNSQAMNELIFHAAKDDALAEGTYHLVVG